MLTGLTIVFENAPSGFHVEFVTPQEALDENLEESICFLLHLYLLHDDHRG